MASLLVLQRMIVPPAERKAYLARLREARDHYVRMSCRFWVFEEAALPGAYLEFTEAPDAPTLEAAQAAAPEPPRDAARVYREVELT